MLYRFSKLANWHRDSRRTRAFVVVVRSDWMTCARLFDFSGYSSHAIRKRFECFQLDPNCMFYVNLLSTNLIMLTPIVCSSRLTILSPFFCFLQRNCGVEWEKNLTQTYWNWLTSLHMFMKLPYVHARRQQNHARVSICFIHIDLVVHLRLKHTNYNGIN